MTHRGMKPPGLFRHPILHHVSMSKRCFYQLEMWAIGFRSLLSPLLVFSFRSHYLPLRDWIGSLLSFIEGEGQVIAKLHDVPQNRNSNNSWLFSYLQLYINGILQILQDLNNKYSPALTRASGIPWGKGVNYFGPTWWYPSRDITMG